MRCVKGRDGKANEPRLEISNNVVCATSTGSDQPAHTRRLIRAFANRLNILWVLSYWWTSFGASKLKRRLHGLVWVYTRQNATLLEITCHSSNSVNTDQTVPSGAVWSLFTQAYILNIYIQFSFTITVTTKHIHPFCITIKLNMLSQNYEIFKLKPFAFFIKKTM